MKNISFFICFLSIIIYSSCDTGVDRHLNWNPEMANSLEELKAGFRAPPIDFSTAPFWVWNDRVTEEKIDFQLVD